MTVSHLIPQRRPIAILFESLVNGERDLGAVPASIESVLFEESVNEAIRTALPDLAIRALELITHLGDGVTLVAVLAALYWFGTPRDQQTRALVLAIGLLALSISAGLKGIVAAPRPDVPFGDGMHSPYSFPSSHALGSAAVYGAVAAFGEVGTKRSRSVIAGAVVTLVALSRIVVGAHYLGDVLAGAAIGIGIVAVVDWRHPDPGAVFALAGVIALVSLALGSTYYTTATIGAAIGATLAWQYTASRSATLVGRVTGLTLSGLAAVRLLAADWMGHWLFEIGAYAIAMAEAVSVPALGIQFSDRSIGV